ncbi:MAG TPA: hypothetical protein VF808_10175 [Ktedonobacterales bacterium]
MVTGEIATRPARGGLLRRVGAGALLPITVFAMALALWYNITGDGRTRFGDLDALLRRGALTPDRFSLIGPLFSAPLYLLGAAFGYPEGGVVFFNLAVFIIGLIALRALLRRHLAPATLRRFLLLLTAGSMFPAAVASYYGETFTAIAVSVGLAAALLAERRWARLTGWLFVALGVANTPATLLGLGLALLARVWATRRLRYALPGAVALALIMGESLLRRGSFFATGYMGDAGYKTVMPYSGLPGFSYPFLLGAASILFSFGKGLVFYTPGLFLPVKRRMLTRSAPGAGVWVWQLSCLLFVAGLIALYASWWGWTGDWYWGPRFFLIAGVPASCALAVWASRPSPRLWVNAGLLALLALSIWVGVDGAVFGTAGLQICQANHNQYGALCAYTPDYSALWVPFENLARYGFSPTFARVEYFQSRAALLLIIAPVVWLYLAAPLLRAAAEQSRNLGATVAPILRARVKSLRF